MKFNNHINSALRSLAVIATVLLLVCSADAADKSKTTEGTFLGIEEGDYTYWVMKPAAGKKVAYFILKVDKSVEKVLNKPKPFIGKKCRVQWKTSMEDIPEAGGKMQVDQILNVEWVEKK